jgi:imidazolonepropionase-like amidohydrolase
LINATVVDVRQGRARPQQTVLLDGDRIRAVGPSAAVSVPAGAATLDLEGRYVIPGLVDGHIHFFQSGGLYTRPDALDLRHRVPYGEHLRQIRQRTGDRFRRYLASGVTTVVDNGGPFWNFAVRARARRTPRAPRVFVAGPLIASYQPPQLRPKAASTPRPNARISATRPADAEHDLAIRKVTTVAEALALLREQLAKKPDLVKIWYVAAKRLVDAGQALDPQAFFPIARAVARESHRAGVPVFVHATELRTAKLALRAGADVLVHSVTDRAVDEEFVRLARERNAIYVPTAWVFNSYASVYTRKLRLLPIEHRLGDPRVIDTLFHMHRLRPAELSDRVRRVLAAQPSLAPSPVLLANLRRVHAAGIRVAAGTDAGNIGVLHGPALHHDLRIMRQAGLSPAAILRAATLHGAHLVGRADQQGTVEPGRAADLVVLDENPLTDIRHLEGIHRVIRGGRIYRPEALVPRTPEALAQIQLNAYNSRDLEVFLSVYHPRVEVYDFPSGALRMRGRPAMRKAYAALFSRAPRLHCRLRNRIVQGRWVFDREVVTGMPGRDTVHATAIYEIRDGLIRRVWFVR